VKRGEERTGDGETGKNRETDSELCAHVASPGGSRFVAYATAGKGPPGRLLRFP
jgi:hypothetical protein